MSHEGIDASQNIGTEIPGEPDPIETQARALGWVPKEEFRGDPDKWRDAEEFVRHGEEVLPVLRENNRKLHAKLEEQNKRLGELSTTVKSFAEYHKKTSQRAYERALKKLKEEQLDAVEDGDTTKFKEIEGKIEDLEQDHSEKSEPDPGASQAGSPDFAAWHKDNTWYGDEIEMSVYADQAAKIIATKNKGIKASDLYEKVAEAVKEKFPEKFQNNRRYQASTVEGGGLAPGAIPGSQGKGYSDLPADARAKCDEYVKERLLTKEQYVKDYFAE